METLPPVPPANAAAFTVDVDDIIGQAILQRTKLDHLVQHVIPEGDLLDALRQGRYAIYTPTSGRRWVIPGRGFAGKLYEWLEERGFRRFQFGRTTYIAPPAPAPLPDQEKRATWRSY